jgi:hypothetical protein
MFEKFSTYSSNSLKQDPMVQSLQKKLFFNSSSYIKNGSFGVFFVKHSQEMLGVQVHSRPNIADVSLIVTLGLAPSSDAIVGSKCYKSLIHLTVCKDFSNFCLLDFYFK